MRAYSSFEGVSSDHRIVTAKILLSLCRNKKQTVKTTRYDRSSLTYRNISNRYTVTAKNKFDTFQEISERHTPNDEYKNLISAHMGPAKAAAAVAAWIPIKPRVK